MREGKPFLNDLALLRQVAREAGKIALGFFGKNPEVFLKTGGSPVSEADLAVDAYLKKELLAIRSHYGWISEETADERPPQIYHRSFIVDPIDGTRGFLDGSSQWCVSLAIVEDGRPLYGVLDCPVRGEQFSACAGDTAWCDEVALAPIKTDNEKPLRLACTTSMVKHLPHDLLRQVTMMPYVPSLAYRLAMLAAGRCDVVLVRPNCHDWDIAAADLIVQQSGGRLADVSGKPVTYGTPPHTHGFLIAASTEIHGQIARYFR